MQCNLQNVVCDNMPISDLSVRYGRVPKRSRELSGNDESPMNARVTAHNNTSTPTTPVTPTTPQLCSVASPPDLTTATATATTDPSELPSTADLSTVYDVICRVSQAHRTHSTYTEENAPNILRKPIQLPDDALLDTDYEITATVPDALKKKKILLWQHFATRITPGVKRVVEFAKLVPGFCDFSQDDQLILIKLGFFEIWLSHATKLVTDGSLTFDDGSYLSKEQLELIYDSEFATAFQNFANGLNEFGLNDTEIGLFSALVLLTATRNGITEHKQISRTRDRIADALRVQLQTRSGSSNSLQLVSGLEAKVSELKTLGAHHCSHLNWLRNNWTHIRLPPLFAEIFDIPKCDDDE